MDKQHSIGKSYNISEFIFFSNYFYGLCAVGLSVEATLQQRFPLNGIFYFFLVFITTVLYYGYPYIRKCSVISSNRRTNWYTQHYNLMRRNQILITIILFFTIILFLKNDWKIVAQISAVEWALVLVFPVVAALYYGINVLSSKYNLRKIGWLKPFIIGFTWAGLVTIYPVLFYSITNRIDYKFSCVGALLFVKNFMFITILCIMFDVKDYAADYISRLKTFVVKIGLRKTIFYIVFPSTIIGLVSFIYYAAIHQFNVTKILLNTIPFLLLIFVGYSLRKRRTILYYLSVVDGLMLAKAVFGTIAIIYF